MAVDYGTLTTAALVAGPDGSWTPLLVDGAETISSAVTVGSDGGVVAGPAAWRSVPNGSGGFVAAPLRLGRDRALVGGVDVAVADLVAATLRLVADAARERGPVGEVRLVVPAGWGPRQRTWMRQAAARAGLTQASLVDAPVVAAGHLISVGRLRALVGDYVLVVDLGAGCEATIVRRTPAGFEVLSTLDDPDAGGVAVDDLLVSRLAATQLDVSALARVPDVESSLAPHVATVSTDAAALAGVRAAKEALSTVPAVTVGNPPYPPTVMTAAAMGVLASPVWAKAATLAVEAVAAADLEPSNLSAVLCVGGNANLVGAVGVVGGAVGATPVVPDEPARAALWGAAGATPTSSEVAEFAAWEVARTLLRHVPVLLVAGLASLLLFAHFIQTVEPRNGTPRYPGTHYYIIATWGELALSAVCALIACLTFGVSLAAYLADERQVPLTGVRVVAGMAGASLGAVTAAGAYSILGSFLLAVGYGPFLRWTLLPMLPVFAVLGVAALIVRRYQAPVSGWLRWLSFPAWSLGLVAAGMALLSFCLNAVHWPNIIVFLDLGTRLAGVTIGIGLTLAVVSRPLFRLLLGVPVTVFCLLIAGWRSAGLFAVMFALAVAAWLAVRIWTLIREQGVPAGHVG
ncbi:Hsp70 family protein [Asanoa ferruginea]|uniref:Hsp70 family protein n=1 Tax=Asanoa ferruginea TaxID=53367 RepID=UPI001477818F|nr:Hsp70 family protein [Asanoa ferruginea]